MKIDELTARIILTYDKEREACAVAASVIPDNSVLPKYICTETISEGSKVITEISGKISSSRTFLATIDDLLGYISVAERILSSLCI